jgi:hypothetical protein
LTLERREQLWAHTFSRTTAGTVPPTLPAPRWTAREEYESSKKKVAIEVLRGSAGT